MIYRLPYTQESDKKRIRETIENYSFVTLISVTESGEPIISHVPVIAEFNEVHELINISGHIAKANPHSKVMQKQCQLTVIFHGPHTYISPTWYKSGRDVPTWNYTTVHVGGQVTLLNQFRDICKNLVELTQKYEGPNGWKFFLPSDLDDAPKLEKAIIAFSIKPQSIEAKFKLAQSRPAIDQASVVENLKKRNALFDAEVAELMQQNLENVKV